MNSNPADTTKPVLLTDYMFRHCIVIISLACALDEVTAYVFVTVGLSVYFIIIRC
jgi:hypothetical protein